jgi:hypothetical protein
MAVGLSSKSVTVMTEVGIMTEIGIMINIRKIIRRSLLLQQALPWLLSSPLPPQALISTKIVTTAMMMTGMSPVMSLKAVIERHATGWNRNAEADMPVWIGSKKFGIMATNGA